MIKEFNEFCDGKESYSQIRQDMLPLFFLGSDPGYFVEFGACDGVYLSNTFLLETYYGWSGLLVEPSSHYNRVLKTKRSSTIDTLCVADQTGNKIEFTEVAGLQGLSGISEYAFNDVHTQTRKDKGFTYEVDTISLKDLLDKHNAPETIDYISIDTEGSEYSILNAYDFSRKFKIMSVEHNNTYTKDLINDLLISKGYINVLPEESKWDSWYVLPEVYSNLVERLGYVGV
jgi:FkbM family methyltransferase